MPYAHQIDHMIKPKTYLKKISVKYKTERTVIKSKYLKWEDYSKLKISKRNLDEVSGSKIGIKIFVLLFNRNTGWNVMENIKNNKKAICSGINKEDTEPIHEKLYWHDSNWRNKR